MRTTVSCLVLLAGASLAWPQEAGDRERAGVEFFEKRIRPILVERCYECHSPQAKKLKGNLLLDTRAGLLKGGDLGPSLVPGNPDQSLLVKAVRWIDEDLKMPPKKRLPPEEVADLEAWVKMGAPDPRGAEAAAVPARKKLDLAKAREFWAFRPLASPPPPSPRRSGWARNGVDAFILHALEARGLEPVTDADPRTLLRRLTFDLTGLPPAPEEMEAFAADPSEDAYARAVERLLASPAYGERWGRHWLDVVRYADTAGDNSDYPIPQMYRYRDYVIRAFNEDKPFDVFIREQIAGDLLPWRDEPQRQERIIATGYIANTKRFGSRVDDYPWHLTYEDTIENLGRTFLGLSLACSRCHDHKFDPVTMDDYYALYGIFESTRYPWPGIELDKVQRDLVALVPPDEEKARRKVVDDRKAALEADVKAAEAQKKGLDLAVKPFENADLPIRATLKSTADAAAKALERAKKTRDDFAKQPLPFEQAYAVVDKKKGVNAKIQMKGLPERPGPEVPRRFLEVLGGQRLSEEVTGSGRLQLADWIADPSNPLTSRVMANRIWQHHFGRGIVPTPNDFGKQGKPPTHPELLDWLAARFLESGGSVKAMHRLLVHSRAYRMSSRGHEGNSRSDPTNEWYWRFNRRRLEAEAIRDAMLAVTGTLDRSPAPPHPFPPQPAWDFTQHKPFKAVYDSNRRSVYLMTQRVAKHPFLGIFDGAETNASTAFRGTTTTTLQALYFLNDPFLHDQARKLSVRLAREEADDVGRIRRAYLLLYGRPPLTPEVEASRRYLLDMAAKLGGPAEAWESYARVLLRTSEFVTMN
jgi:hypothetical protein